MTRGLQGRSRETPGTEENKLNRIIVGHALAAFTSAVWGLTFVSSKILLRDFTPFEILFDRFVIGFLGLAVLAGGFHFVRGRRHWLSAASAALTGVVLYFISENGALEHTAAANVSIIVSSAPFFVAIVNRLFGDHAPLSRSFIAGFFISMSGICIISSESLELEGGMAGNLLALAAALLWGFYCLSVRRLSDEGFSSGEITGSVFLCSLAICLPMMPAFGYSAKLPELAESVNWGNLLFLGVLATAVCFYAWNLAVRYIGSVSTSVYLYAQPALTAVAAIPLLGERLTLGTAAGIVLTVAGLAISQRKGRAEEASGAARPVGKGSEAA